MMKVPDGTLRILVQGGSGCSSPTTSPRSPTWSRGSSRCPTCVEPSPELEALTRNVQNTFSEIIEQIPYLPEELQLAVTNIDDPSALGHLIAGALRISTEEKQELLEEVDVAKRLRRLSRDPHPRARGGPARHQDPVPGRVGDRQGPARVLPAPADEGDPGRARRGRRAAGRGRTSCASGSRRRSCPRRRRRRPSASWAGSRSCRPPPPSTASSAPTSSGWSSCPGTKETEDNLDIEHAREVLDEDHYDLEKVKDRILEYLAVRKLNPDSPGPDPLLRRPARRRQDQPRPVDRPRARPRVRAHLGRRRPRRGRDPRPPPHLHRRDARDDHPRAARRRHRATRCS